MEPLSIATGVVTMMTASGHVLQGLDKVCRLRHRSQEFISLWDQANTFHALLGVTETAIRRIRDDEHQTARVQDCLANIDRLTIQANKVFAQLHETLQYVTSRSGQAPSEKPSKRIWLRRKSELLRLTTQVSALVVPLNAALSILQGVKTSSDANQTSLKINMILSKMEGMGPIPSETSPQSTTELQSEGSLDEALAIDRNEIPVLSDSQIANNGLSRQSSCQTFQSAISRISDSSGTMVSFRGSTLVDTECKSFCSCQCHVSKQSKMPSWFPQLLGYVKIHGNSSMVLNRQLCDKKHCRASGSARLQISYSAPTWILLKKFSIYIRAERTGLTQTVNIFTPRVISNDAVVWSIIELGKIAELRDMLCRRDASIYDVSARGVSLLKYAVIKGQNEILTYLLAEKADPFFRDQSGMIAIQPGIDRVLSGSELDRNANGAAQVSSELYTSSDNLDHQGFQLLHLIVLGFKAMDLEAIVEYGDVDIDTTDANGRTPLLWAAWRGDIVKVGLLLKYGANVNKADHQQWTPLAKACKAGHLGVVLCLLEAKANLALPTSQGFQPIHHASANKTYGAVVVKELLTRGVDVNAYSDRHETALHNAANRGSVETIQCLLDHGANIDAADGDGDTPAIVSLLCWNQSAFLYLANSGARLDIVRKSGHSVVHIAVWCASTEVWEYLTACAEAGNLTNIDIRVRHNGHSVSTCFHKCRDLWYAGVRDVDVELVIFQRMIYAFGPGWDGIA
ncbi:ankyrin repeat-containing domain protein [Pyrenochaeta sp. MPI-SDFR-AT-0127]|nr:ankyrin repeat-containing domain protein [Pyrenochaeta sp. MPI-SDFR-AT-0127]